MAEADAELEPAACWVSFEPCEEDDEELIETVIEIGAFFESSFIPFL